jgi:hypothetical protein
MLSTIVHTLLLQSTSISNVLCTWIYLYTSGIVLGRNAYTYNMISIPQYSSGLE